MPRCGPRASAAVKGANPARLPSAPACSDYDIPALLRPSCLARTEGIFDCLSSLNPPDGCSLNISLPRAGPAPGPVPAADVGRRRTPATTQSLLASARVSRSAMRLSTCSEAGPNASASIPSSAWAPSGVACYGWSCVPLAARVDRAPLCAMVASTDCGNVDQRCSSAQSMHAR